MNDRWYCPECGNHGVRPGSRRGISARSALWARMLRSREGWSRDQAVRMLSSSAGLPILGRLVDDLRATRFSGLNQDGLGALSRASLSALGISGFLTLLILAGLIRDGNAGGVMYAFIVLGFLLALLILTYVIRMDGCVARGVRQAISGLDDPAAVPVLCRACGDARLHDAALSRLRRLMPRVSEAIACRFGRQDLEILTAMLTPDRQDQPIEVLEWELIVGAAQALGHTTHFPAIVRLRMLNRPGVPGFVRAAAADAERALVARRESARERSHLLRASGEEGPDTLLRHAIPEVGTGLDLLRPTNIG